MFRNSSRLLAPVVLLGLAGASSGASLTGRVELPLRNWSAPPFYEAPPEGRAVGWVEQEGAARAPEAVITNPLAFVGVTPCRVADTRLPPVGEFGQPFMGASTTRSFTITGQCSIPADAEAVSFNFTVTDTAGAGFLLAFPAGGSVPGVSTLNYLGAQTIANAAVVPLGTLGPGKGITVIPGAAGFHLIVDVNGYYTRTGTVQSVNGLTGVVSVTAGSNVTVTPSGQNVQVSAGPLVSSVKGLTGAVNVVPTNGATVSAAGQTVTVGTNATALNTPNSIVARDANGGFAAGTIELGGGTVLLKLADGERLLHRTGVNDLNLFFGPFSGSLLASSGFNSAFGDSALARLTSGSNNTALGYLAHFDVTTGGNNVAIGQSSGGVVTTGSNNIHIGQNVDAASATEAGTIRIGNASVSAAFIRGISTATVTGSAVVVNASGQLGVATSSARFKESIADLGDPSSLLLSLRPVSFVYRKDETRTPQVGLIAEEVEMVAPALVVRDENGVVTSVRYDQLVPLLLAEAQRLERENAAQRRALDDQAARLRTLEELVGNVLVASRNQIPSGSR
ncbi:MAG: tail fiber domain-containing protein [Holophagales bacterium]|nr:tail fiber domain-containing protein [Holophagales bacterium]MBK9966672.1 tail fiber domain-containing protein [Holophagales bacterium]